jgi:protein-S-isoprenylcysteine O-methyltransferase Ste14
MSSASQQPRDATTASVANPGLVRPPLVVLASLLSGAVLTVAWPLSFFPHVLRLPVGCLLVAMAAALFTYSIRQFRMARTPVPGNKPTAAIVRSGPRFSRNPIYLAFFALHLGLAIWVNSLWLVATLIPTVAIIAVVVVPREERYLTGRFGAEYLEYKASVRRWL